MSSEGKPRTLSKDDFTEQILESSRPALVDFWAEWCAPCRRLAPSVERLAETFGGRLTVGKVNVDDEPELARSYGIRSIPSLLVFRDGEVVDRLVGALPYEELAKAAERVLAAT